MIAASLPLQRPPDAKVLAVDSRGSIRHWPRTQFTDLLRRGDLVVANDAATFPASLCGRHLPSGLPIEVRLAGRSSLDPHEVKHFSAVVFGAGDFRTRTEDRPLPPQLRPGDVLALGPLTVTVVRLLNHPRLIALRFEDTPQRIWEGLVRHGHPIQYSHLQAALDLWDTWTAFAGPPVAFEPPSAGFVFDWGMLGALRARGVHFATITHAAGISSTGDAELDARLPFDEPYRIPNSTARAIRRAQAQSSRIIAIGTSVVRALEHAAAVDGSVNAGQGLATQRIDASTRLRVTDAILSGTHEPGTSHYELLRAYLDERMLLRVDQELNAHDYRTHEFGDSVFIERERSTKPAANRTVPGAPEKSLAPGRILPPSGSDSHSENWSG